MKTSQIRYAEFKKKLNFGNVYLVEFENDDEGEAIEKTEPQVGDEWTYELEETQYGTKVKRQKEQKFGGKGGSYQRESFEERAVGFAYSYSKDWLQGKDAKKENWVDLANFIYDAMLATAKRGKP